MNELEEENIYWAAYADVSFGNVEDGHTQIGYAISLADGKRRCPIWLEVKKIEKSSKTYHSGRSLKCWRSHGRFSVSQ